MLSVRERVVMLAAIERLAVGQRSGRGIHGLGRVVSVNACLGGGRSLEPAAVVESAVAKERTDFPAVDVLLSGLEILLDLGFAFLHTRDYLRFLFGREVFEGKWLSRSNAEASQLFSDFLFFRSGGSGFQVEGGGGHEARH